MAMNSSKFFTSSSSSGLLFAVMLFLLSTGSLPHKTMASHGSNRSAEDEISILPERHSEHVEAEEEEKTAVEHIGNQKIATENDSKMADAPQQEEEPEQEQQEKQAESVTDTCDVHHNEALHGLMDRICELCHDMYSHQRPNMRADCRSNCFRSHNFKRCLRLFRPIAARPLGRNHGMRHMAEAMDALTLF